MNFIILQLSGTRKHTGVDEFPEAADGDGMANITSALLIAAGECGDGSTERAAISSFTVIVELENVGDADMEWSVEFPVGIKLATADAAEPSNA